MKETDKIDPEYLKGFNDGYIIAKYEPELAEKLAKIKAVTPRIIGIQQGREQLLKEQLKEKLPSWLRDIPMKTGKESPAKKKDRDIDKEF